MDTQVQGLWHWSAWLAGGGMVSGMILPPRYTLLIGFLPFTLLALLSLLLSLRCAGLSILLGDRLLGLGVGLIMVGSALADNAPPWQRIGMVCRLIGVGCVLLTYIILMVYVIIIRRRRRSPRP